MKKSRFTEQQIAGILKESQAGSKTTDVCRKRVVGPVTSYKWKSKLGGTEVNEVGKMHGLEDETAGSRSCSPTQHSRSTR